MAKQKQAKLGSYQRFFQDHDTNHWKQFAEANQQTNQQQAQAAAQKTPDKKSQGNLIDKGGRLLFGGTAKLANQIGELGFDTKELARAITGGVTGNDKAINAAYERVQKGRFANKGSGIFGAGGFKTNKEAQRLSTKDLAKTAVGGGLETSAEVLPFGRGLSIASKGAKTAETLARGAVEGAGYGAIGSTGSQLVDKGKVDLKKVAEDAGLSGVLGALGAGVGRAVGRGKAAKAITDEGKMIPEHATITDESKMIPANVPIRDKSRLLGAGASKADSMKSRLAEIDARLGEIKANPNSITREAKTLENAGETRLSTGAPTTKAGKVDMRTNAGKRQGTVAPDKVAVKSNADEARALMRERSSLMSQLEGKASKAADPAERARLQNRVKEIDQLTSGTEVSGLPTLEKGLAGAKPRYSYGSKQFSLNFKNDVAKALYIVAQKNPSKRDGDYMNFLRSHFQGKSDQEIMRIAKEQKDSIKVAAKDSKPGALSVPHHPEIGGNVQVKQPVGALSDAERTALANERKAVVSQMEGLDALPKPEKAAPKVNMEKPSNVHAVQSELDNVERSVASAIPEGDKITGRVNVLRDYAGIGMTKTLEKIGLGKTSRLVEKSFENMRRAQYGSEQKVREWARQIKSPESKDKVFGYLNGEDVKLSAGEQKVADEMKSEFSRFADELKIPQEGRVKNYITRLFDKDVKDKAAGKNYDPLVNAILENKAAKDVKNPFLQKRAGAEGYTRDPLKAYEAYSQKANRQIHMDGAVKAVAEASKTDGIDQHTADYLARASQTLSGRQRQAWADKALDGIVDSTLGTNRGGTKSLRAVRNTIYRATLGLNVGSAVQNLTQGVNTFAEYGAKDTLAGYSKLFRTLKDANVQKLAGKPDAALDELRVNGVFDDTVRESPDVTRAKNILQKVDKGLWAMFDTAEKVNRGAAYYAAKNKALAKGLSEEAAQEAGSKAVAKTQFKFNEIETPLGLQGEVAKSLIQFQSFSLRQGEYLGKVAKGALQGDKEDIAKAVRFLGANMVVYGAVGGVLGMDWKNGIPFATFRGISNPSLQVAGDVKNIVQGKDKYGNDVGHGQAAKLGGEDLAAMLIPGGTQAKKTIQGVQAVAQGASTTDKGRVRFTVPQTPGRMAQAAAFGQYSLPESRAHFANGNTQSLTAHQSDVIQNVNDSLQPQYLTFFDSEKGMSKRRDTAKKEIQKLVDSGQPGKAERKVNEWNDAVDRNFSQFFRDYNNPEDDLVNAYASYKIPVNKRTFSATKPKDKGKY